MERWEVFLLKELSDRLPATRVVEKSNRDFAKTIRIIRADSSAVAGLFCQPLYSVDPTASVKDFQPHIGLPEYRA